MRIPVIFVSMCLAAMFAGAFWATFARPLEVEQAATGFIRAQLEEELHEEITSLKDSALVKAVSRLAASHSSEIAEVQQQIETDAPKQIAEAIARMQNLSCECRRKLEHSLSDGLNWKLLGAQQAQAHLEAYLESTYSAVVNRLLKDLRIFTGISALSLFLVALVALRKAQASAHLLFPAALLLCSTIISAYFYLFEQNWFFTIVYNDYVGLGYMAYVAAVFAFLCDIALNRARVTTEAINAGLRAIGSAVSVVPC
ncbi:MAG TPA: hypothetical protein VLI06_20535 [Solimonas sp.]|nr:hypothetical protein [Solimonas sp.]